MGRLSIPQDYSSDTTLRSRPSSSAESTTSDMDSFKELESPCTSPPGSPDMVHKDARAEVSPDLTALDSKFKQDQRVMFTPIGESAKVKGFTVECDNMSFGGTKTKMWKCVFFRLQRQVFQWIKEENISLMDQQERCKGTLIKWCQEKLFGFIAPDNDVGKVGLSCVYFCKELGGEQEKGEAPTAGWRLEFEIEHTRRGYRGRNVTRVFDKPDATGEETDNLMSQCAKEIEFFPDSEFFGDLAEFQGDEDEINSQPSDDDDDGSLEEDESVEDLEVLKPRGNPNYPHPSVYIPDRRKKWKSRVKYSYSGGPGAKLIDVSQTTYNKHIQGSHGAPTNRNSQANRHSYLRKATGDVGRSQGKPLRHTGKEFVPSRHATYKPPQNPNPYAPAEIPGVNINLNVQQNQYSQQQRPAPPTDAYGYQYQQQGQQPVYYMMQQQQQVPAGYATTGYTHGYEQQQYAYGYSPQQMGHADPYATQQQHYVQSNQLQQNVVIPQSPMAVPNTPCTYASIPTYTFNIAPTPMSPMVNVASPMFSPVSIQCASPIQCPASPYTQMYVATPSTANPAENAGMTRLGTLPEDGSSCDGRSSATESTAQEVDAQPGAGRAAVVFGKQTQTSDKTDSDQVH